MPKKTGYSYQFFKKSEQLCSRWYKLIFLHKGKLITIRYYEASMKQKAKKRI